MREHCYLLLFPRAATAKCHKPRCSQERKCILGSCKFGMKAWVGLCPSGTQKGISPCRLQPLVVLAQPHFWLCLCRVISPPVSISSCKDRESLDPGLALMASSSLDYICQARPYCQIGSQALELRVRVSEKYFLSLFLFVKFFKEDGIQNLGQNNNFLILTY